MWRAIFGSIVAAILVYLFGAHNGYEDGYAAGHEAGKKTAYEETLTNLEKWQEGLSKQFIDYLVKTNYQTALKQRENLGYERGLDDARNQCTLQRFFDFLKKSIQDGERAARTQGNDKIFEQAEVILETVRRGKQSFDQIDEEVLNQTIDDLGNAVEEKDLDKTARLLSVLEKTLEARELAFQQAQEELNER